MAFSPIKGSAFIEEQYKRYLSTMFMIDNPDYQSQFAEQIKQHSAFSAGPYLDVHDNYKCGSTTRELVQKGILPKTFLKYGFHHDRPLYTHQEIALEKAMHGENIVVSTGTGSGKTESFLMPILANLAEEAEAGTLGKGVRALIIYPMNALANDQVERLRTLLKNTPQVTFGCYTGQTRQTYKDAYYEYKKLNGTEPNSNELISRDQMKEYPPNLLITNYAMLEYLMVRPKDTPLFQDNTWKFVVLDEAHIYRGSTGIEVSMLLRRLKATLSGKKLQYFITSATLGDETENAAVADFATNLCDSPFSAGNIIRAIRIPVPKPDSPIQVPIAFYKQIKDLIDEDYEIDWINQKVFREYPNYNLHPEKPLFDLIRRDERYWKIRNLLKDPVSIKVLQDETGLSEDEIESFVAVASFCEADGIRLLDARYHSFLRATDSVFVTLAPSNKLFLTRNKQYLESADGQNYKVFEIATCSSCHRIYLVGKLNDQTHILEQNAGFGPKDVFYLGSDSSATDDDTEAEEGKNEPGTICAICGRFTRDRVRGEDKCEHSKQYQIPVVRAKTKAPDHRLKKCIHCEAVNNYGILRYFFTGQEAVTSVIATSLFEVLPSQTQVTVQNQKQEDEFGFGFVQEETEPTKKQTEQARQFLCFSDSRQASAYFATYLDTSYRKLLYKRCIYEELQKMNGNVPLRDFCEDLSVLFEKKKILAGTGYRKEKESWKAILSEMADGNGDTSLSGMGMMSIGLRPGSLGPNAMLHMTGAEVTDMFNILLRSLITDLAVTVPVAMNEEDREFYAYGAFLRVMK